MNMKFGRNTTDPEAIAFWAAVDTVAEEAKKMPAWMKSGVDIPPQYENYEPERPRTANGRSGK
jgi:hypothetical protein